MAELSAEEAGAFARELAKLSAEQYKALQDSVYMRMLPKEAEEYDRRRLRIAELWTQLHKFKPKRISQ
jgi:hypothetical protein